MSLSPDAPFCSFTRFENPGFLKVSECGNRLICFWPNYSNLSDAFDPDGMLKRRVLGIVLWNFAIRFFFYREHSRFDEEGRAFRVVARRQNFDGCARRHPVECDGPRRKWQRRARTGPVKRNANWAPTTGAPVHPVFELLHGALRTLCNRNSRVWPHELDVGVQKLCAHRCGALAVIAVNIGRNL